jgi:cobalt-zinc-cadmium efflux system protein
MSSMRLREQLLHGHHHGHHHLADHTHEPSELPKNGLRLAFLLTTVILLSQLIGGLLANSLALFSEAGHVVTDLFALGLAWFAATQAERPANARRTFGYHRAGILAALINAVTLILIAFVILLEAVQRLRQPAAVQPVVMFITPLIAIAINVSIALLLRRGRQTLNTRAALLHVMGDVGASLAVLCGGFVLLLTGWTVVDPLLSIGIALLLAYGAWQIVREATDILLEAAPRGLSVTQLANDMLQIEGVQEVHDLHVWTIASGMPALSCHATIEDAPPGRSAASIRRALTTMLTEKYHIDHATIQFESEKDRHSCCQGQSLYCCLEPGRRPPSATESAGVESARTPSSQCQQAEVPLDG